MSEPTYDVFLSHSSSDKLAVEILARKISSAGLKPFLDRWHLIPGEPWQEGLEAALEKSRTCAVFLGPGGIGAWQNEEMRDALAERVRGDGYRVIPVLLPGARMPEKRTLPRFLKRLTWVDFREDGLEDSKALYRLACGIQGIAPGQNFEGCRSDRVRRNSEKRPATRKTRSKFLAMAVLSVLAALLFPWVRETLFKNSTDGGGAAVSRGEVPPESPDTSLPGGGEIDSNSDPSAKESRSSLPAGSGEQNSGPDPAGSRREKKPSSRAASLEPGIGGEVVDHYGQPIQGVQVMVVGQPEFSAVTDWSGAFSLRVPFGERNALELRFAKESYISANGLAMSDRRSIRMALEGPKIFPVKALSDTTRPQKPVAKVPIRQQGASEFSWTDALGRVDLQLPARRKFGEQVVLEVGPEWLLVPNPNQPRIPATLDQPPWRIYVVRRDDPEKLESTALLRSLALSFQEDLLPRKLIYEYLRRDWRAASILEPAKWVEEDAKTVLESLDEWHRSAQATGGVDSGLAYLQIDQFEYAFHFLQTALERNWSRDFSFPYPNRETIRRMLARSYLGAGYRERAKKLLAESIREEPEKQVLILDLAICLIEGKEYGAAIEQLGFLVSGEKGVNASENGLLEFWARQALAFIFMKQGDLAEAVANQAIAVDLGRAVPDALASDLLVAQEFLRLLENRKHARQRARSGREAPPGFDDVLVDPLIYSDRGDYHEGIREISVSGHDIELIGAIVDMGPRSELPEHLRGVVIGGDHRSDDAVFSETELLEYLTVQFYVHQSEQVNLTVRELETKEYYWLEIEPRLGKAEQLNFFHWPRHLVLEPLNLRAFDLVPLVRLGKPSSTNVRVAPAVLGRPGDGGTVRGYSFTFKVNGEAMIGWRILGPGPVEVAKMRNKERLDSFSIYWQPDGAPEGNYLLQVEGYFTSDNSPVLHETEFYHNPSW